MSNLKDPPDSLYYAALFGFRSSAEILLENGAPAHQPGGFHRSPLTAAERNGHKDIFDMLSTWNVSPSIEIPTAERCPRLSSKGNLPLPIQPIKGRKEFVSLIDIGANLTKRYFDRGEIGGILRRASQAGLTHVIITGTNYASSREALEICEKFDGTENVCLRCTIGIHPHSATGTVEGEFAKTYDKNLEKLILSGSGRKYCVAVGECGLDYSGSLKPLNALHQKQVFRKQLELAAKHKLPVFAHSRNSHVEFFGILKPYLSWIKAVVHCYADPSLQNLRELLRNGVYIGLTGIICDKREGRFNKDLISAIPLDRMMIETDSPYLFPRNVPGPWGNWQNEPCLMPFIIRKIAQVRGDCTEKDVAMRTTEVAKEFFDL